MERGRILTWVRRACAASLTLLFACALAAAVWLGVVAATLPPVESVPHRGEPSPTAFMRDAGCGPGLARTYRPLEEISPLVACAVVRAEDRHYFQHDGVDWRAVRGVIAGGLRVGASTLPMQLARNLFLSPERSVARKVRELALAPRLVERLGRRRVLELYLNVAEWGRCRYGVEEGARWWFGHGADRLDLFEASLLAALLPRPRRPLVPDDAIVVARKQGQIILQLGYAGLIPRDDLDREMHELDRTWRALVKTKDAEGVRAALHERARNAMMSPSPLVGAGWLEAECGWAP